jgi:hypothetical protein
MKLLTNPEDKQEILRRLGTIGPSSQRRWGKMTVAEMICHLSDALLVAVGEKHPKSVSNWFSRTGMKWIALRTSMKWPHGVQTVPECMAGGGGTPPAEMERDLRELRGLIDRFTRQPRDFELQLHPIFGRLTEEEWMRWGYLHMDHHLRQFGA